MKTITLTYTTACSACGRLKNITLRGMAQSQADWATSGTLLDCKDCGKYRTVSIGNVRTVEK